MDQMRDLEVGRPKYLNNHLVCTDCAHFYLRSIIIIYLMEAFHPYGVAVIARGSESFK